MTANFAEYKSEYYASPGDKKVAITKEQRRRVLAELMSVAKRIEKRRNKPVQSEEEWRQQFDQILDQIFTILPKNNKEASN